MVKVEKKPFFPPRAEKKPFFPPRAEKRSPDLESGGQVYMKNTPLVLGGFDKGWGSK